MSDRNKTTYKELEHLRGKYLACAITFIKRQAGLSILAGTFTISRLINSLSELHKTPPTGLEHLHYIDLACSISSNQQAKVTKDEYTINVSDYCAYKQRDFPATTITIANIAN